MEKSRILIISLSLLYASGCAPTVKVAAPEKPIEINLNIKIEHEIKVKVDEELNDIFDEDEGLF